MKDLTVFSFDETTSIRTALVEDKVWFVVKDMAEALDYPESKNALAHCKNANSAPNAELNKINNLAPATKWINESDVKQLISKSTTKSSEFKEGFYNALFPNDNTLFLHSRLEIEFLTQLKNALNPFGIEGKSQFSVLSYKLDFYIPELKIAIEYDEGHHRLQQEADKERQCQVEKELGCRFIRVSHRDSHAWNIGKAIKEIFNLKQESKDVTSI